MSKSVEYITVISCHSSQLYNTDEDTEILNKSYLHQSNAATFDEFV